MCIYIYIYCQANVLFPLLKCCKTHVTLIVVKNKFRNTIIWLFMHHNEYQYKGKYSNRNQMICQNLWGWNTKVTTSAACIPAFRINLHPAVIVALIQTGSGCFFVKCCSILLLRYSRAEVMSGMGLLLFSLCGGFCCCCE